MSAIGGANTQLSSARGYRTITVQRNPDAAAISIGGNKTKTLNSSTLKPVPEIFSDQTLDLASFHVAEDVSSEFLYRPPSDFNKIQMATFATVRTGQGVLEISNAGSVSASFDTGGGQWYSEGLDGLSGPARAAKVAEKLAARFGGTVHSSPTAVTQQVYDVLGKAEIASVAREDYYNMAKPARFSTAPVG